MQGKELYVGTFPTESSAAKAHDVAALRLQREDTAVPHVKLCLNMILMVHKCNIMQHSRYTCPPDLNAQTLAIGIRWC